MKAFSVLAIEARELGHNKQYFCNLIMNSDIALCENDQLVYKNIW